MKKNTLDGRARGVELAQKLERTLADRLKAVLLFGSVARGEAIEGVSDVNVLVLIDRIDPVALRAASGLAREWAAAGNTPPLVFETAEVPKATDAFAIEFSDMIDAHELLFGTDPLGGLTVERRHLRLQAERELRGKLVQLREMLLLTANEPDRIGLLLGKALPSFVTYQRAVLRLVGRGAPSDSAETIRQAADIVGGDPAASFRVLQSRKDRKPLSLAIDDPVVTGYYALAERTADFVDTFSEKSE